MPGNGVGLSAEGKLRIAAEEAQSAGGGSGEVGEPLGEAGPAGPVAVLIPPAVFEKEDAVLDLPMSAHGSQQVVGTNVVGTDAGQEVARIGQLHRAIVADDITIHAQRDLTAWKGQPLANVLGIV